MTIFNAFYLYVRYCDPKATPLCLRETIISSYLGLTVRNDREIYKIIQNLSKNTHRQNCNSANTGQSSVTTRSSENGALDGNDIHMGEKTKHHKVVSEMCTKNKKKRKKPAVVARGFR